MTQCHGIWETVVFFEHIVNAINFMFFTSMKSHATSYFGSVVLHQTGIWLNRYSSVHIFLNQKKKKKKQNHRSLKPGYCSDLLSVAASFRFLFTNGYGPSFYSCARRHKKGGFATKWVVMWQSAL